MKQITNNNSVSCVSSKNSKTRASDVIYSISSKSIERISIRNGHELGRWGNLCSLCTTPSNWQKLFEPTVWCLCSLLTEPIALWDAAGGHQRSSCVHSEASKLFTIGVRNLRENQLEINIMITGCGGFRRLKTSLVSLKAKNDYLENDFVHSVQVCSISLRIRIVVK